MSRIPQSVSDYWCQDIKPTMKKWDLSATAQQRVLQTPSLSPTVQQDGWSHQYKQGCDKPDHHHLHLDWKRTLPACTCSLSSQNTSFIWTSLIWSLAWKLLCFNWPNWSLNCASCWLLLQVNLSTPDYNPMIIYQSFDLNWHISDWTYQTAVLQISSTASRSNFGTTLCCRSEPFGIVCSDLHCDIRSDTREPWNTPPSADSKPASVQRCQRSH